MTPTGLCCNEFPPGVPEEDRNPYCCAPNETCCPNQGCTVLDNCPCGQSECESGVCCGDRVVGEFVPVKDGDPICIGGDVDNSDPENPICYEKQECCGSSCIKPSDCKKYVDDYIFFGTPLEGGWMDLCCCADDEFGANGCCCPGDGTAQQTCKEYGVTYPASGTYTVDTRENCGCPCACSQNAGNAIVPDCKRECPYTGSPGETFTMKTSAEALVCKPKEKARPCKDGPGWYQVLCDGSVVQACPEDFPNSCVGCDACTVCLSTECLCCVRDDCTEEQAAQCGECLGDVGYCNVGCYDRWPPSAQELCKRQTTACRGRPGIANSININAVDCEGFFQYTLNGCGGQCGGRCAEVCDNGSLNCGKHCGESCQECCGSCGDLGSEPDPGGVGDPGGAGQGENPLAPREKLKGNSAFRKLFGKRVEK